MRDVHIFVSQLIWISNAVHVVHNYNMDLYKVFHNLKVEKSLATKCLCSDTSASLFARMVFNAAFNTVSVVSQ